MEAIRTRGAGRKGGKIRNIRGDFQPKPLRKPKEDLLHVHRKHLEEVYLQRPPTAEMWRSTSSHGKEDGHRHAVQQSPLQDIQRETGERINLCQPQRVCLGESPERNEGSQRHVLPRRVHSMPNLQQSNEVCEAD